MGGIVGIGTNKGGKDQNPKTTRKKTQKKPELGLGERERKVGGGSVCFDIKILLCH